MTWSNARGQKRVSAIEHAMEADKRNQVSSPG